MVQPINGNGNNDARGLSTWKPPRDLINAIKDIGIPGAIAIYLVYIGATEIPKITRALDRVIVELQLNRDQLREHMAQTQESIRISKLACRYAAGKDANAQRYCD